MSKTSFISLTASLVLAITFTLSCSGNDGDDDDPGGDLPPLVPSSSSLPAPSSSSYSSSIPSSSYYVSLYGISDAATCQYMDEMLLGVTEDDWEAKGFSFADMKGAWDQYRVSGTGAMLFSQGGYTEDVLRAKMTQGALTPSELNDYMRGLNQRGNVLSIHFPSEIVAFYNGNNSFCYAVLYVENETPAPSSSSLPTPSSSSYSSIPSSSSIVIPTQYYVMIMGNLLNNSYCQFPSEYLRIVYPLTNELLEVANTCLINSESYTNLTSTQVATYLSNYNLSTYASDFNRRIAESPLNAALLVYTNTNNYLRLLIVGYQ